MLLSTSFSWLCNLLIVEAWPVTHKWNQMGENHTVAKAVAIHALHVVYPCHRVVGRLPQSVTKLAVQRTLHCFTAMQIFQLLLIIITCGETQTCTVSRWIMLDIFRFRWANSVTGVVSDISWLHYSLKIHILLSCGLNSSSKIHILISCGVVKSSTLSGIMGLKTCLDTWQHCSNGRGSHCNHWMAFVCIHDFNYFLATSGRPNILH